MLHDLLKIHEDDLITTDFRYETQFRSKNFIYVLQHHIKNLPRIR